MFEKRLNRRMCVLYLTESGMASIAKLDRSGTSWNHVYCAFVRQASTETVSYRTGSLFCRNSRIQQGRVCNTLSRYNVHLQMFWIEARFTLVATCSMPPPLLQAAHVFQHNMYRKTFHSSYTDMRMEVLFWKCKRYLGIARNWSNRFVVYPTLWKRL